MDWFVATLRQYPEIALFLSLGIGYWVGGKSYKGFSLGAVTATLLAAIAIGQLGIKISGDVKSTFFLIFLFAIGYGVGPQFVRGITKDGVPQAIYAAIVCVFCLGACVIVAKAAGYDSGAAAGLFAGSQTISASMGLATDAINRLALTPDKTKAMLDIMPTAYAVTYIFGTIGSAIVIAIFGPMLLRIDLKKAAKEYEELHGGKRELGGLGDAWRAYDVRAFLIAPDAQVVGKDGARDRSAAYGGHEGAGEPDVRLGRAPRRNDQRSDERSRLAGRRPCIGGWRARSGDRAARAAPAKRSTIPSCSPRRSRASTSTSPAKRPMGRRWRSSGAFRARAASTFAASNADLPRRRFRCSAIRSSIGATSLRSSGARRTRASPPQRSASSIAPTDVTDVAFLGIAITIGALIGAVVLKIGGVPITLSTAGGALILGIVCGMVPRDSSDLRPHSVAGAVVHELRRPQHVHRGHRTHRRSEVRRRAPAARLRPLLMGRRRHERAVDPGDVSLQNTSSVSTMPSCWAPSRERGRRRRRSAWSATPRKARFPGSATPLPMPSATRC